MRIAKSATDDEGISKKKGLREGGRPRLGRKVCAKEKGVRWGQRSKNSRLAAQKAHFHRIETLRRHDVKMSKRQKSQHHKNAGGEMTKAFVSLGFI